MGDKHTPGPWLFINREVGSERTSVATVHFKSGPFDGDHVANTRLIAAAPELLGACELALKAFETNAAIDWSVLSAAIAKARGQ